MCLKLILKAKRFKFWWLNWRVSSEKEGPLHKKHLVDFSLLAPKPKHASPPLTG